jgi:hypothetical protein
VTVPVSELLGRLVSERWKALPHGEFFRKFEEEVSEEDELCRAVRLLPDGTTLWVLASGLVIAEKRNRYSLFETTARVQEREHKRAWNAFMCGAWVNTPPREPGFYFCRDREGKRHMREFQRVRGRLVDVSGDFVPWGQVTTFMGEWWSEAIPNLPGSY